MTGTDKIPLLLIPGVMCTARLWRDQIKGLADIADCHVASHATQETITAQAADILRAAPARFALAGHSMGGYLAFEIWRQAKDRIPGLALIGTSARRDTEEMAAQRTRFIRHLGRGRFIGMGRQMVKQFLHPANHGRADILATIQAMAEDMGADAFIRQQKAVLSRPDSRDLLAGINVPALVLCGMADKRTPPEMSREMADAMPDAELVLLDRSGHLPMLEEAQAVTDAMHAWLRRV